MCSALGAEGERYVAVETPVIALAAATAGAPNYRVNVGLIGYV